jgi:hypothetical protein
MDLFAAIVDPAFEDERFAFPPAERARFARLVALRSTL